MSPLVYLSTSIGILAGNYVYQFICPIPDWAVATERSFFQGWALLLVGLLTFVPSFKP